jgi:hypothetical protein
MPGLRTTIIALFGAAALTSALPHAAMAHRLVLHGQVFVRDEHRCPANHIWEERCGKYDPGKAHAHGGTPGICLVYVYRCWPVPRPHR